MKDYLLYYLIKTNNLIKCEMKINLKNEMKDNHH